MNTSWLLLQLDPITSTAILSVLIFGAMVQITRIFRKPVKK